MKRTGILVMGLVMAILLNVVHAAINPDNNFWTGRNIFREYVEVTSSGTLNVAGTLQVAGSTVTDDLNIKVTPVVTANANGGTNVVVFTITDLAGAAATSPVAFRFVISDDGNGTPAAVAGDVAISGGIEVQQVVDKAHYYVMTTNGATSTLTATITDTPGGTNYIHAIAPCGVVTKATSAFDVP